MDLKTAFEILEIKDYISIKKLKKLYRKKVKQLHPDITDDPENILQINSAYKFLMNFLENYEININKVIDEKSLEEKTFSRFDNDWLGGNK
jgi:curved DNA-binding protein CbpA